LRIETKEDSQRENSKFHTARVLNDKKRNHKTQTTIIHNRKKTKATQTNQNAKKKKQNVKGNPFFELIGSERRQCNRRQWMVRRRQQCTKDGSSSWSATELDNGGGRECRDFARRELWEMMNNEGSRIGNYNRLYGLESINNRGLNHLLP